ncbi:MAG: diphosphomevalonate decarboxylase [Flavobacteriaceae bacterium]|nr:diphosphomevalonate decarboxylase [Flavobacteriaceae bacterium]
MKENDFIFKTSELVNGYSVWESPGNIALVKYWGKEKNQVPKNPSISFTLSKSKTITKLRFRPKKNHNENNYSFLFNSSVKQSFHEKIDNFFFRIEKYIPAIRDHFFEIESKNTFPHSSGIASSASSMSSLALCLMDFEKKNNPKITKSYFLKKASFLARLGSGSASRSISGPVVSWGKSEIYENSSDLFGTKFNKINEVFRTYQDSILIIDNQKKAVSSSVGHHLMESNPYAKNRFIQANENINLLKSVLEKGDIKNFIQIVESEALSLHAMMMTSSPSFILMKPNTLSVIDRVIKFRKSTSVPICFTLDAGSNIHLLYPKANFNKIQSFIQNDLIQFCDSKKFINDEVGDGAKKILS